MPSNPKKSNKIPENLIKIPQQMPENPNFMSYILYTIPEHLHLSEKRRRPRHQCETAPAIQPGDDHHCYQRNHGYSVTFRKNGYSVITV